MRLVLVALMTSSCALAFGAGTRAAPAPEQFKDEAANRLHNEPEGANTRPPGAPTFGMSLVMGGHVIDAGSLPPPPIPIVAPL